MRVDLPAPLSPRRQSTSPAETVSETPASATTGPNCLVMSRTSMSGAAVAATGGSVVRAAAVCIVAAIVSAPP
jgi:hypothetical protein